MTTPVKPEPTGRVLTGDEWEAAQYAPHRLTSDPKKPLPPGRVLTGDEWEQAQRSGSLRKQTFPAMPKFAADATRRLNPNSGEQDLTPTEYLGDAIYTHATDISRAASMVPGGLGSGAMQLAGILGRQVIAPAVEHPLMTAAMMNPVGAVAGGMMAAHTVAKYGWQVAHESQMTPEERAEAQKDPERVSGEAAAVQAVMLGLGAIAGVRGARAVGDVGAGMMEAGARGVRETDFGLTAEAGDAAKTANLRAQVTENARRYFETEKGAEVLGTTAGAHGLPETASPFPPASALDVAWKQGHALAKPTTPLPQTPPEGYTRLYRAEGRVIDADSPPIDLSNPADNRGQFFTTDLEQARKHAWVTGAMRGGADVWAVDVPNEVAAAAKKASDARGDPWDGEHIIPRAWAAKAKHVEGVDRGAAQPASIPSANIAPPVTPEPAPTANMAGPGEPGYKGPAALYGRLSDDALATEYRALIEKRTTEEPGAQAPLWDAEREARAVEQIENRRRPDGSLAPADKRALANLQAAQGEMYGVGRHTFESAAAERRLNEINKHITAIEKEIGNRGKNPVDFMQAPAQGGGGLTPIEGTGETVQRGSARSIERKAVEDGLVQSLGELPQYERANMAHHADLAVQLLADDPVRARRIALGEEPAPAGMIPEAVSIAVENKALAEGDVATLYDIAAGKLTEEATTMGQRIRTLGERNPESPVDAIKSVVERRSGGAKAKKLAATTVKDIEKNTELNLKSLMDFFDSVKC